ncbi:MAG: carbonic anhydrase [Acidobacteria bacterium]|nr:carbonic anhydrase [Acidobacteriota bacterium]
MTEMDDIRQGVLRFRKKVFPIRRAIYEELAHHQDPQVLFITCIDSRVDPADLCDADPGDMFVERTPGNMVPIYSDHRVGVSASIEYAVTALGVTDIIICGHSDCGALKALLHPEKLEKLPAVERWLHFADEAIDAVNTVHPNAEPKAKLHHLCEQNVIAQLDHLGTHPCVAQRLKTGYLRLHGWVYEIHTGEVHRYDATTKRFALWPPD